KIAHWHFYLNLFVAGTCSTAVGRAEWPKSAIEWGAAIAGNGRLRKSLRRLIADAREDALGACEAALRGRHPEVQRQLEGRQGAVPAALAMQFPARPFYPMMLQHSPFRVLRTWFDDISIRIVGSRSHAIDVAVEAARALFARLGQQGLELADNTTPLGTRFEGAMDIGQQLLQRGAKLKVAQRGATWELIAPRGEPRRDRPWERAGKDSDD
ncbi:unnamed protein product, partial [Prorocentrum cordatum]